MKIKDGVLVEKKVFAVFEFDVEGTKVEAVYSYEFPDEVRSGWEYDLSPCYVGLTDDEIDELEDEFAEVISNTRAT